MSVLPVLAVQWLDVSQMVTAGYNLFKSWRGLEEVKCDGTRIVKEIQSLITGTFPATSQISGAAIPLKVLC